MALVMTNESKNHCVVNDRCFDTAYYLNFNYEPVLFTVKTLCRNTL